VCERFAVECRQNFLDAFCPEALVDEQGEACHAACPDAGARENILAFADLACAELAELAIEESGLRDVCVEPDPCEDVACPAPAPSCDGAVAVTYSADEGECSEGACDFAPIQVRTDCDEVEECVEGACVPIDLCGEVVCENGLVCVPHTGLCVPFECTADDLEPNDTPEILSQLESVDQVNEGLSICEGDTDYFGFTLPAGQSLLVRLYFVDSMGDIDTEIRNGGTRVARGDSISDNEVMAVAAADVDRSLVLQVFGFDGTGNAYDLELIFSADDPFCRTLDDCDDPDVCVFGVCGPCEADLHCVFGLVCTDGACVTPPCEEDRDCSLGETCDVETGECNEFICEPDAREPNDDAQSATPLPTADQLLEDPTACDGDDDFFAFTLPANRAVLLRLHFIDSVGDVDVHVLEGDAVIGRGTSSSDNESVYLEAADTTRSLLFRIFGFDGQNNRYTLELILDPVGGCAFNSDCDPDEVCTFGFCAAPPPCVDDFDCGFAMTCDRDTGQCVVPPCEEDLDCPFGESCDLETGLCLPLPCEGDDGCGDGETCDVETGECIEFVCVADRLEPNDEDGDATPVGLGMVAFGDLSICGGNDDYFSIGLRPGSRWTSRCSSPTPSATSTFSSWRMERRSQRAAPTTTTR
jgi:hypothetical protein